MENTQYNCFDKFPNQDARIVKRRGKGTHGTDRRENLMV